MSRCIYDHIISETPAKVHWGVQRLNMYNHYFDEPMLSIDERMKLPAPPGKPPPHEGPASEQTEGTGAPSEEPMGILTDKERELPCRPERCYKVWRAQAPGLIE